MTTLLNGLLGGLVAGLLAAVAVRFLTDGQTAATAVVARLGGLETGGSTRWLGVAVQLVYGCLAGGALVALELYVLDLLAVPPTAGVALGLAVAWSALLLVGLLGAEQFGGRTSVGSARTELFVYHLVYGVALGLWIRLTWIT